MPSSFPARSWVATTLLAVALTVALSLAPSATHADGDGPDDPGALDRAGRILADGGTHQGPALRGARADATLAMRDLFLARPRLDFISAFRAEALLARPTDGPTDPGGDGFAGPHERLCGEHVCVHYAVNGSDAPDGRRWVRRTLAVLESTWTYEVERLGFRPPPPDGRRGGDRRFDVYLTDLGDRGLFGYCSPERRVPGQRFNASSYCILDDDFDRRQYDAAPRGSLRVTAAHEFFHAIQFGYDFREDPWLLESTATWIEERLADGVDDNLRFLRYGSVRRPGVPLDSFSNSDYAHYGAWAFWEHLSERYGARIVRDVWARADARSGARDDYSLQALEGALAGRGGVRRALTSYAINNLRPAATYDEGERWPRARVGTAESVDRGAPVTVAPRVRHLSAQHLRFRAAGALTGDWRLRLTVDGPRRRASPMVRVEVRSTGGEVRRHAVALDRRGRGSLTVAFDRDRDRVRSVIVTLVNASTRYDCREQTMLACAGEPRDEDARFRIKARAVR